MEIDSNRFNNAGPAEQAEMILSAAARARGLPPPAPKGEAPDKGDVAALIIHAGQRRRGELP